MKKRLNYLFTMALIILTFYILLRSIEVSNLVYLISSTNKLYIVFACAMMVIFWLTDALILRELSTNILKSDLSFSTFNTVMIGQYYGLITPFAGGSQPAQLYYIGKKGVPLSKSAVILLNKYVIYEAVVTIYSFILYILHLKTFTDIASNILPFINLGFLIHIVGVLGIIALIYSPRVVEIIVKYCLVFSKRIKIINNIEEKFRTFEGFIDEYRNGLSLIRKNKILLIKVILITFIQLAALFMVSYFVYRALNLNKGSIIEIVSLQAILYIAVTLIPTPGTLGASEVGYYTLYSSVYSSPELLAYSLLLWRGITFYFNLIVSGTFSLLFYFKDKR